MSQVCTLRGHSRTVNSIAFSPDGKRVVSGSRDKLVKIWDAASGAEVSNFVGVLWVVFCLGDSLWFAHGLYWKWSAMMVWRQVRTLREHWFICPCVRGVADSWT